MHVWLIAIIQWNGNHQHYQFAIIFMMGPLQTVMPLINPSVWFFGIGVKSHDVTTVEPFRYSIPPPNRSTSFHSISSCPGHTTKLTLCNLTKRGYAVKTEFLSCSVTIFGWLLSYASPKSIFLISEINLFAEVKRRVVSWNTFMQEASPIEAHGVKSSRGNPAILIDLETLKGFRP